MVALVLVVVAVALLATAALAAASVRILREYERGVVFRLGRVLPQRGPYIRFLLIALLMLFVVLYRPRGVLPEEKVVSLTPD